ncbi:MAG TPA: CNNM domain-containing protein, partial [Oligoflexia bacterium]|nr:CNNM domain-containing protein [Oligoflexia bacterium]
MLFALFIALVLILINALYVAAEFGSVAVRRAQVAHLAHTGNENAKQLLPFVQEAPKLDTYVAACQIGITVSSLI